MPTTIKATPPASVAMTQALARTLKAQRAQVIVEPINAELAPVLAYVDHITRMTSHQHHAVTIPEGSTAHQMGYRYVSIPDNELAHYLANGATLAAAADRYFVCNHQSGAHATIRAASGQQALDAFRGMYTQPTGAVTARPELPDEAAARERSARSSRYASFAPR
jgi:hypothetical protein